MKLDSLIFILPKELKLLIAVFCITLSIGFFSGITFVNRTTGNTVTGIEENYLGNEENDDANVMKFKKSEKEILSIIHSHVLSMSAIFFLLGLLLSITALPKKFKLLLMIEPFLSILLTFGGIYFLWKGLFLMKYVILFSGIFMTLSFSTAIIIILFQLSISKGKTV